MCYLNQRGPLGFLALLSAPVPIGKQLPLKSQAYNYQFSCPYYTKNSPKNLYYSPEVTDRAVSNYSLDYIQKPTNHFFNIQKKTFLRPFCYLNLSKKPFFPEPETSIPLALAKACKASF